MASYFLYEAAVGYALFEGHGLDEIGASSDAVQQSVLDIGRFGRAVKLTAFHPFKSAAEALAEITSISEGGLTDVLKQFLELNLPKAKPGKKSKFTLGVADAKLGSGIQEATGVSCACNEFTGEVLRGIRQHFPTFVKDLSDLGLKSAQLGLAHSYSRSKVQFNVHRQDNMIIQAISLLDTLDKDVNTFVMRVREWYSWHFPELVKLAADNYQYAQLALAIKDKAGLGDDDVPRLEEITGDADKARDIVEAARSSMGQDISPIDLLNIQTFAARVISLAAFRQQLHGYLLSKMALVAPNLSSLIGEVVGARLISHAGSLTNLAKYPASTVQILGAEKALFRALKTRGNTPKYGLIFHSSFIGRAKQRNKGRISRYLANKCSIASRIDNFADFSTSAFGEKMREQVEERLRFYEEGTAPGKNAAAMAAALAEVQAAGGAPAAAVADAGGKKQKKKKRKAEAAAGEAAEPAAEQGGEAEAGAPKKKKKKAAAAEAAEAPTPEADEQPKKKKKKKAAAES